MATNCINQSSYPCLKIIDHIIIFFIQIVHLGNCNLFVVFVPSSVYLICPNLIRPPSASRVHSSPHFLVVSHNLLLVLQTSFCVGRHGSYIILFIFGLVTIFQIVKLSYSCQQMRVPTHRPDESMLYAGPGVAIPANYWPITLQSLLWRHITYNTLQAQIQSSALHPYNVRVFLQH